MSPQHSARIAADLDVAPNSPAGATHPLAYCWSKKLFHDRLDRANAQQQKLRFMALHVCIIDAMIMLFSVFSVSYAKQGTIILSPDFLKFLLIVTGAWLLGSTLFNKFNHDFTSGYQRGVILITRSSLAILFIIVNTLVLTGFHGYSRIKVLGACALFFLLETVVFSAYYALARQENVQARPAEPDAKLATGSTSLFLLVSDFVILTASFFTLNFFKQASLDLSYDCRNLFLIISGIWFFSSLLTRKFEIRQHHSLVQIITPFFKSFLIMFSMMAVTVYAFHLFSFSRTQVFGTLCLFFVGETFFMCLYYLDWNELKKNADICSAVAAKGAIQEDGAYPSLLRLASSAAAPSQSLRSRLRDQLVPENNDLFNFIFSHVDLDKIDAGAAKIMNTVSDGDIERLADQSIDLVINLHAINDFQLINRYFLTVHRKIYNGGYFIGRVKTHETYRSRYFAAHPAIAAKALYFTHIACSAILPKIPVVGKVYSLITRGKYQVISKAEALGRLYFCGFKVIAVKEIDNALYYIAQCEKNPSIEKNPSFKLMIKLKRIGMAGQWLYIRKFRTMYPYSEFLQDFIYQNNHLQSNGKFNGDFRLTRWGKLLRKYWIDELPQLINFLQGDISLVGVRALSEQYYSLYPRDLQELRIRFKPGLIPPYYADMPESFEEIVASERRYLDQKIKKPFTTDIRYFIKSVYNILFRRARSM